VVTQPATHAVSQFPLPAGASGAYFITRGSDGALWFTEYFTNKIGRLVLPALQVTPATNIVASGNQGGPFSPTAFNYQLSSTTGSLNYIISAIPPWLNANFTSGTATTTPVTVTFSLINIGNLSPGAYTSTIAFTNTSTGQGNTTRTATLIINAGECREGGIGLTNPGRCAGGQGPLRGRTSQ
jgi:hypothetical protein